METYPPNDDESKAWNELLLLEHDMCQNGATDEKRQRVAELIATLRPNDDI